jgi:hypothetical protein
MGKSSGGSAPAADPAIGQAALANVQLGKDYLSFSKDAYDEGLVRQDKTDALTEKVANQQLATQEQANTWAKEDRNRTKTVFQPLQDQFIDTAKNYDSPEKQAAAAAAAQADVAKASATQGQVQQRSMASMGINPNSGRFTGQTRALATNTALASAGAGNAARTQVQDKALALRADAINMGNGLASSTAAAYGIGTNAGGAAVGANQAGNANFYQNNNTMTSGYTGAMNGNSSGAGILNNLYGNQVSAYNAQQQANGASSAGFGSAIGSIAGAGITAFF